MAAFILSGGLSETDKLLQETKNEALLSIQVLITSDWIQNADVSDQLENEKLTQRNLGKFSWSAYHPGKLCYSPYVETEWELRDVSDGRATALD